MTNTKAQRSTRDGTRRSCSNRCILAGLAPCLLYVDVPLIVVQPFHPPQPFHRVPNGRSTAGGWIRFDEPPTSTFAAAALFAEKKSNPWESDDFDLLRRSYKPDRVPPSIDYIVVGSGIGGLWLSACLSKFGIRCLVLEQHYVAGGFQHTFKRGPWEFVPALHYVANLELCGPLYDLVSDEGFVIEYEKAGAEEFRGQEGGEDEMAEEVDDDVEEKACCSHRLKVGSLPILNVREGIDNVRRELASAFPDEKDAIDRFLVMMEEAKWQAGVFMTLKILPFPIQWILSQFLCRSYLKYASMTTDLALSKLTSNGVLKTVLSAFGGDLGESLRDGSFVMQAAVLGHVVEGCHFPRGGPMEFTRGLVPTIRKGGGDVLTRASVEEIIVDDNGRTRSIRLANGDVIEARKGVVSDTGMLSTVTNLLKPDVVERFMKDRAELIRKNSAGGISHAFLFVGLEGSNEELGLSSASYYYIPCNVSESMDASGIQDYYRNTLLDESVEDVSAGIVFASAKDPLYSRMTMEGRSTAIVFSEAKAEEFDATADPEAYERAKSIVKRKLLRSFTTQFPHLKSRIGHIEVATPETLNKYVRRKESLGLRHTPSRMLEYHLRPDSPIDGLFFTGQDVSFAGWAGALTGAMVTAQKLLGYSVFDFARKKTLLRDLGGGDIEDMIQARTEGR